MHDGQVSARVEAAPEFVNLDAESAKVSLLGMDQLRDQIHAFLSHSLFYH